jgi:predicted permease
VDLQQSAKGPPERIRVYNEILNRLRKLPGVTSASSSLLTPIGDGGWNELIAADSPGAATQPGALMYRNRVSPGYFQTLGTPFVAGRDFNDYDGPGAPPVIVIDQSAARKFFGSTNPLGKTIRSGNAASGRLYQVIGVVKDAKYGRVDEKPRITGFDTMGQSMNPSPPSLNYELRHTIPLDALTPVVKTAIADVSANISLEFRSFKTQVGESLQQQRLVATLSTVFGALALSLSMVGLYGLTAYSVARRKGEIGVRIALGASTGSILWLVLRDVAVLLAVGTALGALGALAAGRLLTSLLYGVRPNDPVQMAVAAAILATATTVAACLPARRAAGLDPMKVLREE